MRRFRKAMRLLLPLGTFFLLYIPYNWVNRTFLVDWLGCGCPRMDETGHFYTPTFNANTATYCFWLGIAALVVLRAVFLSRRIARRRWWLRAVYVAGMLGVSLWLAVIFFYSMQWN